MILPPGSLIDVGGPKLHLACAGRGDSNGRPRSCARGVVRQLVARPARSRPADTRVRLRPGGIRMERRRRLPRTARRIASEIHVLLERAGVAPPISWSGTRSAGS